MTPAVGPVLPGIAQDSTIVESPLPGFVDRMVQFLFEVPQWIQIGGAILGVLVAAAFAWLLWHRFGTISQWFLTRPMGVRVGLLSVAALVLITGVVGGAASWNYMQHDNGFCMGCHVMEPAFGRFSGTAHDSLSCHDCHQQPITASIRQLYLWVAERPEEIGEHAPVPNVICENCHVTGEPEAWQRVASTAGHRTHLESDSTALDQLMCVTCHGLEVHRFVPVDSTCAQADCHVDTEITLGSMRDQTALHCATCHEFTAEMPLLATRDSAAGTLAPRMEQCFSCHEMQGMLLGFDMDLDPHSGSCGMCHNPHEATVATDATASCATADCHADWENEPFHVGPDHLDVGNACVVCHDPHRAEVDASNCTGCHRDVSNNPVVPLDVRRRLQRVLPFDTTRALQRQDTSVTLFGQVSAHGQFPFTVASDKPLVQITLTALRAVVDTFSHEQHETLSCLTCHTTQTGHGTLTFEAPRGCQICHHSDPQNLECATCHSNAEISFAQPITLRLTVADTISRVRTADFHHGAHQTLECVDCHTNQVTLTTVAQVSECADCHSDHHDAQRDCIQCHASENIAGDHTPPIDAHVACDDCHQTNSVSRLVPDRPFCVTCHADERDHYPEKECTVCHLQSDPDTYRTRLTRSANKP